MDADDLHSSHHPSRDVTLLPGLTPREGPLRVDRVGNEARLAGDIDEFTHAELLAALSSLSEEPGDIHIDLAGVEFCDVAGLRALVLLSRIPPGHADQGRRVMLHGLPSYLEALLQILGWNSDPRLVIVESADQMAS